MSGTADVDGKASGEGAPGSVCHGRKHHVVHPGVHAHGSGRTTPQVLDRQAHAANQSVSSLCINSLAQVARGSRFSSCALR